MLIYNENYQQLNVQNTRAALLNLRGVSVPTRHQIENDLSAYYTQALKLEASRYQFSVSFTEALAQPFLPDGAQIMAAVNRFICGVLKNSSTPASIADAVLQAISAIIPGAIIIDAIVKKLVKYIIFTGVPNFCANE